MKFKIYKVETKLINSFYWKIHSLHTWSPSINQWISIPILMNYWKMKLPPIIVWKMDKKYELNPFSTSNRFSLLEKLSHFTEAKAAFVLPGVHQFSVQQSIHSCEKKWKYFTDPWKMGNSSGKLSHCQQFPELKWHLQLSASFEVENFCPPAQLDSARKRWDIFPKKKFTANAWRRLETVTQS